MRYVTEAEFISHSLAVSALFGALIQTHPDRQALRERFLETATLALEAHRKADPAFDLEPAREYVEAMLLPFGSPPRSPRTTA